MTAFVYRCYDSDGVLLYVGCAFNPKRRIATHMRSAKTLASHALQVLMHRYEVEGPFATREEADAAEQGAILAEQPLLNRQHRRYPGWIADAEVAAYLAERDIPLEVVGLRRCLACSILLGHHSRRDLCSSCRDYADLGQLDQWLELIA